MISAGNDIVSFAETNPVRTKQPAFYKKFLTDAEVKRYHLLPTGAMLFEHYVWLLWSAKEAAFKFLQRHNPLLVFSPSRFIVDNIIAPTKADGWIGSVTYTNIKFGFHSVLNNDFVHTVIDLSTENTTPYRAEKRIATSTLADQSSSVRAFCLDQIATLFPEDDFKILKTPDGIPVLRSESSGLSYPLSLSHHGNYIAYSFCI
ncbi:4'-phosphopantetheinyl transferase superfamily protein [Mucilaginibacter sp.]|uniref:4'-phosphopantetheinyl transferase family protein n=1 Tax=Mucilaginibacter sp. TaxID=1882438 RepID=UPI0035BC5F1D